MGKNPDLREAGRELGVPFDPMIPAPDDDEWLRLNCLGAQHPNEVVAEPMVSVAGKVGFSESDWNG